MSLGDNLRQRSSYLTTADVIELLGYQRNTLCAWAKAGRIPAVHTPGGYRFDPLVLAQWLDDRTTGKLTSGGRA
jgi:hypothetical protein